MHNVRCHLRDHKVAGFHIYCTDRTTIPLGSSITGWNTPGGIPNSLQQFSPAKQPLMDQGFFWHSWFYNLDFTAPTSFFKELFDSSSKIWWYKDGDGPACRGNTLSLLHNKVKCSPFIVYYYFSPPKLLIFCPSSPWGRNDLDKSAATNLGKVLVKHEWLLWHHDLKPLLIFFTLCWLVGTCHTHTNTHATDMDECAFVFPPLSPHCRPALCRWLISEAWGTEGRHGGVV